MFLGDVNADMSCLYVLFILCIAYVPGSRVVKVSHGSIEGSGEVLFLHTTTFIGE